MRWLGRSAVAGLGIAGLVAVAPALSEPVSDPIQISNIGPAGEGEYDASNPRLAMRPNGGLVVYGGTFNPADDPDEDELFGRLVDANGAPAADQFQISDVVGPNGQARNHAVAHNSVADEYLTVWSNSSRPTLGDEQIKAQRISSAGAVVGGALPVSELLNSGSGQGDNQRPRVAYASGANVYLVVWRTRYAAADAPLGDEITGQILAGADGAEIGSSDFLISAGSSDGAERADVAYNRDRNEFLVVWKDETTDGQDEVLARRIDTAGAPIGDESRITTLSMADEDANDMWPSVAYSPVAGEYLVTWHDAVPPVADDTEIFVQRLSGTGSEIGGDQRISTHGPEGDAAWAAEEPSLAWDVATGRWLVVWHGAASVSAGGAEREVFARRLGADAAPDGDQFRLTNQGPDGDPVFEAEDAVPAFSSGAGQMVVVWEAMVGLDEAELDADDQREREVFARREHRPLPVTATPTPTPTATPTPVPGVLRASDVFKLPSAKKCVRRRRLSFRILQPAGVQLDRVVVRVNRKKVRTVRGNALTKRVRLRKLPKRKFVLRVKAFTTDDRSVGMKRRYKGCKKKRR